MVRSPCCEKMGLRRGRWTAEEDAILIKYIQQNGEGSWKSLPKNAGLLRCGKSCRLRWINYLRSDLKRGNFTMDEEEIIIELHRSLGNRWSLIASNLPGRTDNEVKNYWNSHLSRKLYSFTSNKTNASILKTKTTAIDLIKRRGGRVSRSMAKKYNKNNTLHSRNSVSKTKDDIIPTATQNLISRAENTTKTGLMEEDSMEKHDRLETSQKDLETFDNQDDCFLTTTLLDQDWNLALNDGSWDPNTEAQILDKRFSPLSFQLKNEELINNEWDFNSATYGNAIWDEDNDNLLWL